MDKQNLLLLAEYNIWATKRLAQALSKLSFSELTKDVGLHFKSILGTLNHLLVGEHYLWYPRFKDGISNAYALDWVIEANAEECIQQLIDRSYLWVEFIHELTDRQILGVLNYTRSNGEFLSLPFAPTLMHVFNHGTHHRGQITAAITSLGYMCPELDLVYMLVEQSQKQSVTQPTKNMND